ncbi:MAG: 30S ribosomal protein S2 [Patescibacteria group bacterium]|nr:30S ribosomal protein S2 [Patescibacteria group bacterium]
MKIPSIEQMLKAGMHFGHRTGKWHPKMEPFIFGERHGVHIIDLMQTKKLFEEALEFIKKFSSEGKMILFVGTKMQVKESIAALAKETEMPYVKEKWLGGTLTNFLVLKRTIKKYQGLSAKKKTGDLSKYTKKEQLDFDREIEKLEFKVGGLNKMTRLPDAIFVWDIKTEKTAVTEAKKRNIPIIAICDTNVNPTGINYVIPSNDDATKTIKLVLDTVKEAILAGKAEKKLIN